MGQAALRSRPQQLVVSVVAHEPAVDSVMLSEPCQHVHSSQPAKHREIGTVESQLPHGSKQHRASAQAMSHKMRLHACTCAPCICLRARRNRMQPVRGSGLAIATSDQQARCFDGTAGVVRTLPISGRCVHEHAPMLGEAATDLHRNLLSRGACKPIIGPRPPVIISPPPTPRSMVLTGWNTTDNFF